MLIALFLAGCVPAAPAAVAGCGTTVVDPLAAITVAEAHLEEVELWQAGAGVGRTDGRALLVVTDVDGNVLEFDAMMQGSHAGLVLDASVAVAFDAQFPLVLPNTPVTVRGLLGDYEGAHVGLDVIAGFHWRDLQNPASNVRLNVTTLSFGLGFVPITWEVVGIQLFDDPVQFVDPPPPCGFGVCNAACAGGDQVCDPGCGDPDCDCSDDDTCLDPEPALGEACAWRGAGERGDCAAGLVCVRRTDIDEVGVCRQPCDRTVVLDECAGSATCQRATAIRATGVADAIDDVTVEATVCLDRRGPDAPCSAAFDSNACDEGLECRPVGANRDELRCKMTCGDNAACSSDAGAAQCLAVGTLLTPERRGPSTCGVPVAPLPAARVRSLADLDERFTCNEREGRRYCDQSIFDDVSPAFDDEKGVSLCMQLSPFNGDGFCYPLCGTPSIDRDGNGVIDDVEKGASFVCGGAQRCTTSLAIATGMYDAPTTFPGGTVPRPCDPAVCPEGEACAACGPGDATCSTALGEPSCLAPFRSCE